MPAGSGTRALRFSRLATPENLRLLVLPESALARCVAAFVRTVSPTLVCPAREEAVAVRASAFAHPRAECLRVLSEVEDLAAFSVLRRCQDSLKRDPAPH